MTEMTLHGSCLCGSVVYEATGEATRFYYCHCQRCRKATGSGHATNLFLQPGSLKFLKGEDLVRSFKVPEAARFRNVFCSQCGSRMPSQPRGSDMVIIPAGSLNEEPAFSPQAHIFVGSRASWSSTCDGLPTYPEYPTP